MFENGTLLADFKDELVGLYGYSDGLAQDITVSADSIAEHFGREYEGVVLDAVRSTKVVCVDGYRQNGVKETIADVLEREGINPQIDGKEKSDKDLRNVEGMYCEKPNIVFGEGGYTLTSVDKVAIINSPYINDSVYFMGVLSSELMKSVKGQLQAHSIENDRLITKNGLATRTEKLTHRGSVVSRKFESQKGYGLESALNNYDTLYVMRESFYDDFDLQNQSSTTLLAGNLVDGLKLGDTIRVAQVTKDTKALEEVVNSHTVVGYDHFLGMMDEMYDLEKRRSATLGTDEHNTISAELDRQYGEVARVMSDMKVSMKLVNQEDMVIGEGNTL